ncbi:MAG: DMP19 family protein [Alphaproteobacteria bacterium]|nr:DMP19 family protein [Alphaproteobacteria bacterium]
MSQDYWDHIEPFWESVSIYDGPEEFLLRFTEMPEHAAHLFALHWCASEVCNGGFHQFFFNSTGVLAPEAVAGFRAIGMPQTAAVVAAAMASFGEPYPRDREERQDALDALDREDADDDDWDSPFGDIDNRFYDFLGSENGGMERAAESFAARFPIPDGPLRGTGLLNRLLAALNSR